MNLYSNYLEDPQNVDLDYTMNLVMSVNDFISANLSYQTIYDDNAFRGLQTRQVFGIDQLQFLIQSKSNSKKAPFGAFFIDVLRSLDTKNDCKKTLNMDFTYFVVYSFSDSSKFSLFNAEINREWSPILDIHVAFHS